MEALLDALFEIVAQPAAGPLQPERIIVHSRAMAVWLSQRLSERFGGWVGGAFPFPRRFVEDALRAVLGETAAREAEAWSRPRLSWAVLAELPRRLADPRYEPLARILDGDPRPHAADGLADLIADVFDQYLVFRPQMVLGWERGEGGDWQADLWRALTERLGRVHLASLARELFEGARSDAAGERLRRALGPRVVGFGIASLPPLLLQILDAVSRHVEIHLMVPSPSREFWGELRAPRAAVTPRDDELPTVLEGNPLLASFGAVGRDFLQVLEAGVDYDESEHDLYASPDADTLLGRLQADMLHLRHRGAPGGPTPVPLRPEDESIAVHACHSPMREVEVLHDQLLAMLGEDGSRPGPPLAPHEVVVLMSDAEVYAPLVEAVFEREPGDPRRIPYSIADRPLRAQSPVAEAFFALLGLVGGRAPASAVLDLLAMEPVQRRFDISADDTDTIARWIDAAGIRWGIDGAHRAEHGQPRFEENTWRFGLSRLLLGYAMPGQERETYAGVLPYDEIEGSDAVLAGKLARFCGTLLPRLEDLAQPRTPGRWREALGSLLEAMLEAEGVAAVHHQRLRTAIAQAASDAEIVGMDAAVPLPTMQRHVEARLEGDAPARGLLTGGVTFCAMLPMRAIPFRVVVLLGMSDGAFPRASRRIGFDLVAASPRPGDRSRRGEDRWLFLEALGMARDRLLLTYVGSSMIDNEPKPPSVALAELLDVLAESSGLSLDALRDRLVLRHPMQPFSPRYFAAAEDPRLFSYASAYREGAQAIAAGRDRATFVPLLRRPLPPPEGPREVGLERLVRFFGKPAAELLKRRLGLFFEGAAEATEDREPMEATPLESWRIGDAILEHRLGGVGQERSRELLRASGQLPLGTTGEVRWEELSLKADPIATFAGLVRGEPRPALPVDLEVADTRIVGRIGDRTTKGMVTHQYSKVAPKHLLSAWLRHLVLGALAPDDQPPTTVLIGRPEKQGTVHVCTFGPVAEPAARLAALVELYWLGQCEPLLLLPKSSYAYARARRADETEDNALAQARVAWSGRGFPERDDPYYERLFGTHEPLAAGWSPLDQPLRSGDFPSISTDVFGPLLSHMEEQ